MIISLFYVDLENYVKAIDAIFCSTIKTLLLPLERYSPCGCESLSVSSLPYENNNLKVSHFKTVLFVSYLTVNYCLQPKKSIQNVKQ